MLHKKNDIKRIISNDKIWYKKIWSLDIKNMSWVEETKAQVDFIWNALGLTGKENILDLGCGYGRHSLELSKKGCNVIGVDITKDYVEDANKSANDQNLSAEFIHSDIRDIKFTNEFDIVLNMADGAIGYLENDKENLKIFQVAGEALKSKGKQLIDICNAGYAKKYFPTRNWEIGKHAISLSDFDWDDEKSLMFYGGLKIEFQKEINRPLEIMCNPIRLYGIPELNEIYNKNGMRYLEYFGNFDLNTKGSDDIFQIQVIAGKE